MSLRALQGPTGGGAPVGGSGTTNTIPRWTGASTLGDSIIVQNAGGTAIAIGDAAGVSYVGLVQVKRAGGAGWLTLDHTGGSYAEVQSYNVPLYLNRQGNNTILNATSGNVGIGTASPLAQFTLGGIANSTTKMGFQSVSTEVGSITMNSATGEQRITSGFAAWGGFQTFYTNGSERARIDSSGNLLMAGNGTAANPIIANSTGVSGMYFPSATTVAIAANGGIAATFSKVAGAGVALGGTTGLVFDASGSQQGIKLPSASAASFSTNPNTLDCYEEGTWSPTLTGFGGTTPTATIARYTRVGRLVTLHVLLTATGGNQFSSTAATTLLTLPSGMTPAADAAGSTSNSVIGADGPCVAYTNGNLYVPTFALRTANTILTVTYSV